MPDLQINQQRLHYRAEGDGPAVILLHELGGSTHTWMDLQPSLAAAGFRAVALDLRGAGESEVPAAPYSLDDLALDVLMAMDALTIFKAFLLGLAVGGLVALQAAVAARERVLGLILLDTPLQVPPSVAKYSRERAEVIRQEGMAAVVDLSISRSFPPQVATGCPEAVSAYRARFLENDPHGYALASLAILEADFRPSASGIGVPALVLVGENDLLFPPDQVRELARALPQATYHVIQGAGHFPPIQKPDEVRDQVLAFLGRYVKEGE